jgi:hypothetical protein
LAVDVCGLREGLCAFARRLIPCARMTPPVHGGAERFTLL